MDRDTIEKLHEEACYCFKSAEHTFYSDQTDQAKTDADYWLKVCTWLNVKWDEANEKI